MTSDKHQFGLLTKIIHGTQAVEYGFHSHADPIFLTTTYVFDSAEQMLSVFSGEVSNIDAYARYSNPNFRALENRLEILEDAECVQGFNNGTLALVGLMHGLLESGDEIIAHRQVYGGTYGQLKNWENFGIKTIFVDARFPMNVINKLNSKTRMILLETPSNPTEDVLDYHVISFMTKIRTLRDQVLIVVDGTFGSPFNQRPLSNGADIVLHSGTKYINGMGTHLMGSLGMRKEVYERFWARYDGFGSPSPFTAWDVTENIKSSFVDRMRRHNENGMNIALWLEKHPKVAKVYYPGLKSHYNHHVAQELMVTPDGKNGYGGMVSFELCGDSKNVFKFLNQLAKDKKTGEGEIALCVSLGNIYTLICCPAISSHCKVPPEKRNEMGIKDTLIRLSVGIENIEDIIYCLQRGFDAI